MKKLLSIVIIIIGIQFFGYLIIGKKSLKPDLVEGIELPEKINTLLITEGFAEFCGNNTTEYSIIGIEKNQSLLKNKILAKHYQFEKLDLESNQYADCKYFVWKESYSFYDFSNKVVECFQNKKRTQLLKTEYVWILFKWFKLESQYETWDKELALIEN